MSLAVLLEETYSAALARLAQIGVGIAQGASTALSMRWRSGDDRNAPTKRAVAPDARTVPFNQMSKDERLAALTGKFQSTGAR